MISRIFILLIALLPPPIAIAKDDWPEGSAMSEGDKYLKNRAYFSKLVERKQLELVSLVEHSSIVAYQGKTLPPDERLVNAVKDLHTAWLAYYPHECELIGSMTGAGGTWPSTYAVKCQANAVYQRFHRLKATIRCIERVPAADRPFKSNYCLNRLTYGTET